MDIRYYRTVSGREPVADYLADLPEGDRMAVTGDFRMLAAYGLHGAPVATRHLKGKLWEVKTGVRRQQRIFYCLLGGDTLVLLHACKKQREGAQRGDVELAEKRMKEVLA
jgi:phage-related protein